MRSLFRWRRAPRPLLAAVLVVATTGLIATAGIAYAGTSDTAAAHGSAETRTNLALGRTATGSPSCTTSQGPDKAVNGTASGGDDVWCGTAGSNQFLQVDLGSATTVSQFVVRHWGAGQSGYDRNTSAYDMQLSVDGSTFTTAVSVTGNYDSVTANTITATSARYVRLVVRKTGRADSFARIRELEVYADAPPVDTHACAASASGTLSDYAHDNDTLMTRINCTSDTAIYGDDGFLAVPTATTAWVQPFAAEVWRFIRDQYGNCTVPRTLPAPIGPGCERFGDFRPQTVFLHANSGHSGGGRQTNRFDEFAGFRQTVDVSANNWDEGDRVLHDVFIHELCHQVEGSGQGVSESPAFEIWGDSKWGDLCVFDFYMRTDRFDDARRVYQDWMQRRADKPNGATNVAWFRDWFLPLWQQSGGNTGFMDRFFGLLSKHFPTFTQPAGNQRYTRRMNAGEFVHFMSAAAGTDLSAQAAAAFNTGFQQAQLDQARRDFPALTYQPPAGLRINHPGLPTAQLGQSYTLPIITSGAAAGARLRFSASQLPAGLSIDSDSGVISGTPAASVSSTVTVTVTDGTGGKANLTFPLDVTLGTGAITSSLGLCLDNNQGSPVDGNKVQLYRCNGSGAQSWEGRGERILIQGKCLTASGRAEGVAAVLWTCDNRPEQVWRYDITTGVLRNPVSAHCLPGTDRDQPVTLATCTTVAGQQWQVGALPAPLSVKLTDPGEQRAVKGAALRMSIVATPSAPTTLTYEAAGLPAGLSIDPDTGVISGTPTASGESVSTVTVRAARGGIAVGTVRWNVADAYGAVISGLNWCLDNDSNRAVNGNKLQSYRCIGSDGQTWTVQGTRITTRGMCMTASGAHEGDAVVLWACDGRPEQEWRYDATSGAVRNPAADRCLSGPARDKPVVLATCAQLPEQLWLLGQPLIKG